MTDQERLQHFVAPCGNLLTERVDVLARVYAGVMSNRIDRSFARAAVTDFLSMIGDHDE